LRPEDRADFAADIAKWIQKKVANHKRLRGGVVLVDVVPKSPSGKILRKDLRVRAAKEVEEEGVKGRVAKL